MVALYGDKALGNRYLGRGVYLDYVRLNTERGAYSLREHGLYQEHGFPGSARGFVFCVMSKSLAPAKVSKRSVGQWSRGASHWLLAICPGARREAGCTTAKAESASVDHDPSSNQECLLGSCVEQPSDQRRGGGQTLTRCGVSAQLAPCTTDPRSSRSGAGGAPISAFLESIAELLT